MAIRMCMEFDLRYRIRASDTLRRYPTRNKIYPQVDPAVQESITSEQNSIKEKHTKGIERMETSTLSSSNQVMVYFPSKEHAKKEGVQQRSVSPNIESTSTYKPVNASHKSISSSNCAIANPSRRLTTGPEASGYTSPCLRASRRVDQNTGLEKPQVCQEGVDCPFYNS